jgi:hypothetical protein
MKIRYGITEQDKTTVTIDKETHLKVKDYARKYHISVTEAVWLLISYSLIEGKDPTEIQKKMFSSLHDEANGTATLNR